MPGILVCANVVVIILKEEAICFPKAAEIHSNSDKSLGLPYTKANCTQLGMHEQTVGLKELGMSG